MSDNLPPIFRPPPRRLSRFALVLVVVALVLLFLWFLGGLYA